MATVFCLSLATVALLARMLGGITGSYGEPSRTPTDEEAAPVAPSPAPAAP